MFIRSERLFLRPGWSEDWQDLLALIDDREVAGNLAEVPWPYTPLHARQFAARVQDRHAPHFLITLPSNAGSQLIGCIGLGRDGDQFELGYWIARPFWGQGYATEAARAVLPLAQALGHQRIVASHYVDNPASGRVLQKVGFRPAGGVRMRHSLGRGGAAPVMTYAICLDEPGNCGDDETAMRAA
jgi:RimJ/RimL family protein N-acetyltransferase